MALTKADMKMFEVAKDVAATSDFKNFKLGAVIVYKKHILSVGVNSYRTHPTQKRYNKKCRNFTKSEKPIVDSLHAECDALTKVSYPIAQNIDWSKVKIYIYRICPGKKYKKGLAKPCAACQQMLKDYGVRHIYYTTDDSYAYERLD